MMHLVFYTVKTNFFNIYWKILKRLGTTIKYLFPWICSTAQLNWLFILHFCSNFDEEKKKRKICILILYSLKPLLGIFSRLWKLVKTDTDASLWPTKIKTLSKWCTTFKSYFFISFVFPYLHFFLGNIQLSINWIHE